MAELTKREKVFRVFQRISGSYDDANKRISLGLEGRWKTNLVLEITRHAERESRVLDVCSGTGDIAIAVASRRPDLTVTGLDFSPAMLRVAQEKSRCFTNVSWREGDALQLPFADDTFSAACISFGLRNTADYLRTLEEMTRVVKPGGMVLCLDSFVPDSPLVRPFYTLDFHYIMPFLGGGIRHRREYIWLYQSTQAFLRKGELSKLFAKAGLKDLQMDSYLFGACVLHVGMKPESKTDRTIT